jgi:hypothetical protein
MITDAEEDTSFSQGFQLKVQSWGQEEIGISMF